MRMSHRNRVLNVSSSCILRTCILVAPTSKIHFLTSQFCVSRNLKMFPINFRGQYSSFWIWFRILRQITFRFGKCFSFSKWINQLDSLYTFGRFSKTTGPSDDFYSSSSQIKEFHLKKLDYFFLKKCFLESLFFVFVSWPKHVLAYAV